MNRLVKTFSGESYLSDQSDESDQSDKSDQSDVSDLKLIYRRVYEMGRITLVIIFLRFYKSNNHYNNPR